MAVVGELRLENTARSSPLAALLMVRVLEVGAPASVVEFRSISDNGDALCAFRMNTLEGVVVNTPAVVVDRARTARTSKVSGVTSSRVNEAGAGVDPDTVAAPRSACNVTLSSEV